jgi:hypothetical protein
MAQRHAMSQCVNAAAQIQLARNTLIIKGIFYDNGGQKGDVYVQPNPAQATICPGGVSHGAFATI